MKPGYGEALSSFCTRNTVGFDPSFIGRVFPVLLRTGLLIGLLLGACRFEPGSSPILGIDPSQDILSVSEHLPKAVRLSRNWSSTAILVWIDIDVTTEGSRATFAFDDSNNPEDGLLVIFEPSGDDYSVHTREVHSEGKRHVEPSIDEGDWVIDSVEISRQAIQRADEFINENPDADEMKVQLRGVAGAAANQIDAQPGELAWRVQFYAWPNPSLDLYFDPVSGDLIGGILREG